MKKKTIVGMDFSNY